MDNSIYEVERDDFKGFIDQLNPKCIDYAVYELGELKSIRIFAKDDHDRLFAEQVIKNGESSYFVYEMPEKCERIEPKPVRKITLETKEEVEHFFKALNKLQQEHKK